MPYRDNWPKLSIGKISNSCPSVFTIGSLRSATATSTKTSPQTITLLCHKSFAIIPSWSRLTLSVKYPRNELVREISEWKERNERFTVACSHCRQNLEFGDFTSLLCRGPQKYLLKSVRHVQHDYLWFFNQWYHCFVTLLLPSPSLFLKLPILRKRQVKKKSCWISEPLRQATKV